MRPQIMYYHRQVIQHLPIQGPVLEIGSQRIANQDNDFRASFPADTYIGVDMAGGRGVDCIMNGEQLAFPACMFGCVICCEVLEHTKNPFQILAEVWRVLRPNGYFLFSTQFYAELHAYPDDYWRFTPSCYRQVLLKGFESVNLTTSLSEYRGTDWLHNLWQIIRRRPARIRDESYYQARPITIMGYCQKHSPATHEYPSRILVSK